MTRNHPFNWLHPACPSSHGATRGGRLKADHNARTARVSTRCGNTAEDLSRAVQCAPPVTEGGEAMTPGPSIAETHPNFTHRPSSVYRYYDGTGVLLYVGLTSRGAQRNVEHVSKEWWQFVGHQAVNHFDDRPAAAAHEKALIRKYRPPFNVQHNPGWEATRAAYLVYVAAGRPGSPQAKPGFALYRELGKTLPLRVLRRKDREIHMVTDPAHREITSRLVRQPVVHVLGAHGRRIGNVQHLHKCGGGDRLVIAHFRNPPADLSDIAATIRVSNVKGPQFELTAIRLALTEETAVS